MQRTRLGPTRVEMIMRDIAGTLGVVVFFGAVFSPYVLAWGLQ